MAEEVQVDIPAVEPGVTTGELDMRTGTTGMAADAPEVETPSPFAERIPERYRERGYWKNVQSEEQLFDQFDNLQKYRGDSYKVPGVDANEEDWNAVYSRLGRPDTADDYEITMRDGNGMITWDEQAEPWIRNTAHKIGLNPKQAQTLIDEYTQLLLDGHTAAVQERNRSLETLKDSLGDLYERKLTLGTRAMEKAGGTEFVELMQQSGLDTHPTVVKAMLQMGQLFEEHEFIDGRVGSMDRTTAQARMDAIFDDPNHAYWDRMSPNHEAAVKEYENLATIVHGDSSPVQRVGGVIPL